MFNLKLCFPEIEKDGREKILAESYRNFCRSLVEFILLPKIKGKTRDFVCFDGLEKLQELSAKKEGALLVTGHFGSWELLGAALLESGIPMDFLVGEQTNRAVDDLINGIRSEMGIGLIHMGVAAKGILKAVKEGRFVAMLSDQDAGKSSVVVSFFGNPASTPAGIGAFALKLKCPIVAGGIVREGKSNRHKIFVEIIRPDYDNLPQEKEEAIKKVTQIYTERIEHYVREFPQMYFWAHRRFKSTIEYPK
jgi:KDO2-lipid IV(A) lauroyltransferase